MQGTVIKALASLSPSLPLSLSVMHELKLAYLDFSSLSTVANSYRGDDVIASEFVAVTLLETEHVSTETGSRSCLTLVNIAPNIIQLVVAMLTKHPTATCCRHKAV